MWTTDLIFFPMMYILQKCNLRKNWKQQKDVDFCFLDTAGVAGSCYILGKTD